jgi:inner membrane transporter RhtA
LTDHPAPVSRTSLIPYAALVAAMVMFPLGTSYAKQVFAAVGAEGTALYRAGFSALVLVVLWRPWQRRWTPRELTDMALYGGALGAMNLSFYMALVTLPLGIAMAIEFIGPLSVALIHSHRPIHFAAIALAVFGLALLLPVGGAVHTLNPVGVGFALLAALFWALYIVFGRRGSHIHPGQAVAVGMIAAMLVIAPFGLAHAGAALLDPRPLLAGFIAAMASSAVPYSLERVALRGIPSRIFGVCTAVEPAVGAIVGALLLGELLSQRQVLAIACVILASTGSVLASDPVAENPDDLPNTP